MAIHTHNTKFYYYVVYQWYAHVYATDETGDENKRYRYRCEDSRSCDLLGNVRLNKGPSSISIPWSAITSYWEDFHSQQYRSRYSVPCLIFDTVVGDHLLSKSTSYWRVLPTCCGTTFRYDSQNPIPWRGVVTCVFSTMVSRKQDIVPLVL